MALLEFTGSECNGLIGGCNIKNIEHVVEKLTNLYTINSERNPNVRLCDIVRFENEKQAVGLAMKLGLWDEGNPQESIGRLVAYCIGSDKFKHYIDNFYNMFNDNGLVFGGMVIQDVDIMGPPCEKGVSGYNCKPVLFLKFRMIVTGGGRTMDIPEIIVLSQSIELNNKEMKAVFGAIGELLKYFFTNKMTSMRKGTVQGYLTGFLSANEWQDFWLRELTFIFADKVKYGSIVYNRITKDKHGDDKRIKLNVAMSPKAIEENYKTIVDKITTGEMSVNYMYSALRIRSIDSFNSMHKRSGDDYRTAEIFADYNFMCICEYIIHLYIIYAILNKILLNNIDAIKNRFNLMEEIIDDIYTSSDGQYKTPSIDDFKKVKNYRKHINTIREIRGRIKGYVF